MHQSFIARLRVGVLVALLALAALAVGAPSAAAARNGEIAVVDSDASAGLSAIILIPSDRLATRKNSKVLVSGPGTIENVQWTPDGKTLVYTETTDNHSALYAIDVGSPTRRVLAAKIGERGIGALSPDGKTVAYGQDGAASPTTYLIGVNGLGRRRLPPEGDLPAWAADSSRLALITGTALTLIGATGSGTPTTLPLKIPSALLFQSVAWNPDGKSFLVNLVDYATVTTTIETIGANGSVLHVLTRRGGDIDRWSPDGSQVAFGESAKASKQRAVIVKADGSDRRSVDAPAGEPSDEMELAWSPDGHSLVTADGDRVRVVRADGTHAMVIAFPGADHVLTDPAWQPLP